MTKNRQDRSGPLRLILLASHRSDQPVGVAAAPPHLPHDLWRLPKERPEQFYARVLATAVGQGVVAVRLLYADELPKPAGTLH